MKIARFRWRGDIRWGVLQGDTLHALEGRLFEDMRPGEPLCPLEQAQLLPPLEPHNKVLGLGQTYKGIYRDPAYRDGPGVFIKPPNTNIGPMDPIVYHDVCSLIIYEAEVGLVIGREASRLSVGEAADYIGGYTCVNDVTCPRFKTVERPLLSTRFKICDTFCPLGPVIETDLDPQDVTVICRVNGREVERSNTGQDMCFTMAEMLAYVTSFMTLMPGDLIATGSAGTGPLEVGDLVEVDIPGIGVLRNPVVAPR